jgi:hypothetical protein
LVEYITNSPLTDATRLAFANDRILHKIPSKAVYLPLPPSALSFATLGKSLKTLGHHYFDAAGTPVFDLSTPSTKIILFAARNRNVKAPISADKGPAGTGAVDWLFLTDKGGSYTSVGLSQVYRVVTAGGVGPICSRSGIEAVDYATEYWFYNWIRKSIGIMRMEALDRDGLVYTFRFGWCLYYMPSMLSAL